MKEPKAAWCTLQHVGDWIILIELSRTNTILEINNKFCFARCCVFHAQSSVMYNDLV